MFLLVALFRMASLIMFPHWSPAVQKATELIYHNTEPLVLSLTQTVSNIKRRLVNILTFGYGLVEQTLTSFIPLTPICIYIFATDHCGSFWLCYSYLFRVWHIFLSYGNPRIWQVFQDPTRREWKEKEKYKTGDRNAWKKERSLDMEYLLQPCRVCYRASIESMNERITHTWK